MNQGGSGWAKATPNILAVHQGYELYGSDRTFISSVCALRRAYPGGALRIWLPREGDLAEALRERGFRVEIRPLWILRRANGLLGTFVHLLKLPIATSQALRAINQATLCYINTSVIVDYALAVRFASTPSIIHIHEIPTGMGMKIIRPIMRFARACLVFNSDATRRAFEPLDDQPNAVLLNGVPFRESQTPREPFSDPDARIRILMIGRINNWKGQDLLLQALANLPTSLASRIDLRFLGAAFESGPAEREIADLVKSLDLRCNVSFDGFVADPSEAYEWSDLVVVPSKKPEPFGLVAVEAMAHGRALVAASHGGLKEIVVEGETGFLFEPNNAEALAECIMAASEDTALTLSMGLAGKKRYEEHFSEQRYQEQFVSIVGALLEGK
nr:glycosyltransferase family 4 protein [uncultured Devosia sp.]